MFKTMKVGTLKLYGRYRYNNFVIKSIDINIY